MKIVPSGAVVAGEGRWHFMADGKEVGKGAANSFIYTNLPTGQHVLVVALHQGDHSPYPGDTGRKVTVNTGATGGAGSMAIDAVCCALSLRNFNNLPSKIVTAEH